MSIVVSPCTSLEEVSDTLVPILHYFGGNPTTEDTERWSKTIEIGRMLSAREDGKVVGGAGAFTFELTVPGGTVPAAGVTVVGVLPTHRRRGILRAMMRAQLDDVRERGEPVAYLWASEETIYGRFGYGIASFCGEIDLPRSGNAYVHRLEPRGHVALVGEAAALEPFSAIYDRVRLQYPGMFARTKAWWTERRLADPEKRRGGGGVLNRALLTIDGSSQAYALYRMHQTMEAGVTTGFLNVIEAVGTTLEATREIWRFLFDVDWIARVKASLLPVDHPLFFLLARPRLMKYRVSDALWVRLVDVHAALSARTIGSGASVVLEIADTFCPWNTGRYAVSGGGVDRTRSEPDLALEVDALGSAYLGGVTFRQLAGAGRIEERRPGAAARADALFTSERAPWCPEIF